MAPVPVTIKHGAKKHALELDDDGSLDGRWLKQRTQELTSVPAEKVKILVKGGQLKVSPELKRAGLTRQDDVKLSSLGIKPVRRLVPYMFDARRTTSSW